MTALTFRQDKLTGQFSGYQPDGTRVGVVRRSRKSDERCAYEAVLDAHPDIYPTHRHCGYAADPAGAKWMLVCGMEHRLAAWTGPE